MRVFIDGQAGTTGLHIEQRLARLPDFSLLTIDPAQRKDPQAKLAMFAQADVVILCLHDDDARASVAQIEALQGQGQTAPRVIDASTAHRTAPGWVYGFAELTPGQAQAIAQARWVSNPGCYATGAIALLRPLIDAGLLPADSAVCLPSVSGYTGGGRAMIEAYESGQAAPHEMYALALEHKHVPEIMHWSGLKHRPLFTPSVGNFAQGMLVQLPLHLDALAQGTRAAHVEQALRAHYAGSTWVQVHTQPDGHKLQADALAGDDHMRLWISEADRYGHCLLVAQLDNLGKGASGAAVQNLQLMAGGAG